MAEPDTTGAAQPTPLDAERARLRKEGYTEAEVSQILIQRAVGGASQQPAGAWAPQGTMTGVLGNASAVLSHARGTIPAIKSDLANLSNAAAPPKSRAKSAAVLAFAAVVVAVLGYAIYQEWQQHIISATERAKAEACSARVKAFLDSASRDTLLKGNAELALDCGQTYSAAVNGAINAAEIAAAQADKAKAEACTARIDAAAKNTTMGDFLNGRVNHDLERDCDPNYAQREACDAKFKAIFAPLDTLKLGDPGADAFTQTFSGKLAAYSAECPVTEAQKQYGRERLDRFTGKIAGAQPDAPKPLMPTLSPATTEVIEMVCTGKYMNNSSIGGTIDYITINGDKLISKEPHGYETIYDNSHHTFLKGATKDNYVKLTTTLIMYGSKSINSSSEEDTSDYTISRVTGEWIHMAGWLHNPKVQTIGGKCELVPTAKK